MDFMDVLQSSLKERNITYDDFQLEDMYYQMLPYKDQLEDESTKFLADIKANFGRAAMLKDIQPGCAFWTSQLVKYIKLYGMKFSKEDHIMFVKLLYELILIPKLNSKLFKDFSATICLLLKRKGVISPQELELPWRPLYDLMVYLKRHKEENLDLYCFNYQHVTFVTLVQAVHNYFPLSATQEIIDELRPMLYPLQDGPKTRLTETISILSIFLPLQLPPEHHSLGFKIWFEEIMEFWKICHNLAHEESDMLWLIAKLADKNIGYINWEPYLPFLFTKFLRSLNLPVAYKNSKSNCTLSKCISGLDAYPMAIWMVANLGNGSRAQNYLNQFLQTISTFFYPANRGKWSVKLRQLLSKIPEQFVYRLYRERVKKETWETSIPDNYKLTDADIDAFVESMLPVAMIGMHEMSDMAAYNALRYLAMMRPKLVIPPILEKMYSAVDSLTKPHKFLTTLFCSVAIARPLAQGSRNRNKDYTYSEGPMHVLPLLFAVLPGIDPNDPRKSDLTCRFIAVLLCIIPIVDSSRNLSDLNEEERLIAEQTAQFEDFILQLLDRLFVFIDSSSIDFVRMEETTKWQSGKATPKKEPVQGIISVLLESLFSRVSDDIFKSALHKLRDFIVEKIFEPSVAGRISAELCQGFASANGPETLKTFVPLLSDMIMEAIEESDAKKSETLECRLYYRLLLLSAIITPSSGTDLLPYIDILENLLDHLLMLKAKARATIIGELMFSIFQCLVTVKALKSMNYRDPKYPYVRDWGEPEPLEVNMKWYVPTDKEISVAQRLFDKYLLTELRKVEKYCDDSESLSREELNVSLQIINYVIKSCQPVLPVWSEPPIHLHDSAFIIYAFTPTIGIKGQIVMPDGNNVRLYVVNVMSKLQKLILQYAEDDTESLMALIQIWKQLLDEKESYALCKKKKIGHKIMRQTCEDKLSPYKHKGTPAVFKIQRVRLLHELRRISRAQILTETHKLIILHLFSLVTSRYAEIRKSAQIALYDTIREFKFSYRIIIPRILEILKKDTQEYHEEYKGALFMMLIAGPKAFILENDLQMFKELWPALVLCKTSEKPSIINLRDLIRARITSLETIMFNLEVPDKCVQVAKEFWKSGQEPSLPICTQEEILKGEDYLKLLATSNIEMYYQLVDDLLNAILTKEIYWRHKLMGVNFIDVLVHPDHHFPLKVAQYFLQALIHDSEIERMSAIEVMTYILCQQKRKCPKIPLEISEELKNSRELPIGEREDNEWLKYDYDSRPVTSEQWDKFSFIHKSYVGYYAWPKKFEINAPYSQKPIYDPNQQLSAIETEIIKFFNVTENIDQLFTYFNLIEKDKKEKYNMLIFIFIKRLFRNHGIILLDKFLPHLRRLVEDTGKNRDSSQRLAVEVLSGIVRGVKHWPFDATVKLWEELLPIIRTGISNVTVDTQFEWSFFAMLTMLKRDPTMHYWLLEALAEDIQKGESETSFLQCIRIRILQVAITNHAWRAAKLSMRLLPFIEKRIFDNPLEDVRCKLAQILAAICKNNLNFYRYSKKTTSLTQEFINKVLPLLQTLANDDDKNSSVQEAMDIEVPGLQAFNKDKEQPSSSKELYDSVMPHLQSFADGMKNSSMTPELMESMLSKLKLLANDKEKSFSTQDFINKVTSQIQTMAKDQVVPSTSKEFMNEVATRLEMFDKDEKLSGSLSLTNEIPASSANKPMLQLFQTVCWWMNSVNETACDGAIPEFYQLLPILCQIEKSESSKIYWKKLCKETLAGLARSLVLSDDMPRVLEEIRKLSKSSSWSAKVNCLEFLMVFVFHNMAVIFSDPNWVNCVQDIVLELLEDERLEVQQNAGRVLGGLLHYKLIPEQENLLVQFKIKAQTKHKKNINKNDTLRRRHAGILGLCAFIQAHPYDLPEHVPELFEILNVHLNDPQPIPTTIRNVLGEFKRTHYDSWFDSDGYAQKLTEDQLAVFQNLNAPPAYYA